MAKSTEAHLIAVKRCQYIHRACYEWMKLNQPNQLQVILADASDMYPRVRQSRDTPRERAQRLANSMTITPTPKLSSSQPTVMPDVSDTYVDPLSTEYINGISGVPGYVNPRTGIVNPGKKG